MALHNPVEDAQRAAFERNPRGRQALDVARAFLQTPPETKESPVFSPPLISPEPGGPSLPAQASSVAGSRAFGQQGARQRRQRNPGGIDPGPPPSISPLRTLLGGSEQPNRDLLRRVMQRVFQNQRRTF